MTAVAVLEDVDDRVADPLEVLHVPPAAGVEAAGRLPAALDEVRDGGARAEPLPVVGRPAELVAHRTEVERDVGDPAADDDVRAELERLDDPFAAGVDVRRG